MEGGNLPLPEEGKHGRETGQCWVGRSFCDSGECFSLFYETLGNVEYLGSGTGDWRCRQARCPDALHWNLWESLRWMSPDHCCLYRPPSGCESLLVRLDLEHCDG